jgi:hypothetical protein
MEEKDKFLGCFVCAQATIYDINKSDEEELLEQTQINKEHDIFCSYIWGERGISDTLKKLKNENYGQDMTIILFQFYVKPIPYLLQNLKEIESYRKKEKSIGIPIIVTDENFFNKSEEERYNFLKQSIFQKLDLLAEVVKKKKLDTDINKLKIDLQRVFDEWNL